VCESIDNKFHYHLCMTYKKLPSDPFFEEIPIYEKIWLFQCWFNEIQEKRKYEKDLLVFLGSFSNPEMAKSIYQKENPDFKSNEEDFEKSSEMVIQSREKENEEIKRKKKKIIKRDK